MAKFLAFLPPEFDAPHYEQRFRAGLSADSSPWGFGHVARFGHDVTFTRGRALGLSERIVRKVLGCNFWHAWVNRTELAAADAILTHTERDYLAAAAVLRLIGARGPVLQGNVLWLFFEFSKRPVWQRLFARWAWARVDLHTCNATPNAAAGRALGIGDVSYVPYGISVESFPVTPPVERSGDLIASIGTDRARDWEAVVEIAIAMPQMRFRVASQNPAVDLAGLSNVEVRPTNGVTETNALYGQASLVVLPLLPNFHASGITVLLEAVARGVPVVCGRQGGLDDYFTAEEVWYYGDDCQFKTLIEATRACLAGPAEARARAERAQQTFLERRYDSVAFIERLLAVFDRAFAAQR
jgi:glycosyltransferase involved in cell wall biosynthesis